MFYVQRCTTSVTNLINMNEPSVHAVVMIAYYRSPGHLNLQNIITTTASDSSISILPGWNIFTIPYMTGLKLLVLLTVRPPGIEDCMNFAFMYKMTINCLN